MQEFKVNESLEKTKEKLKAHTVKKLTITGQSQQ